MLSIALSSFACNSTRQCGYPFNNPFTTTGNHTDHFCCAVMPRMPLADAKTTPIRPPHSGYCPPLPADLIVAQGKGPLPNTSLYPDPEVFFVGGLTWGDGDPLEGHKLPRAGIAGCATPHSFYTQYVSAYANDTDFRSSIPVLGSAAAPAAALLKAADSIAEMLRQLDSRIPGVRRAMVEHGQRFAVWADSERRNDTCQLCKRIDPTFDCGPHIDSRPGRDSSYHPEFPECVEGGGADRGLPTTLVEEYGIPYLEPGGGVRDSYCGTNIVVHCWVGGVGSAFTGHIFEMGCLGSHSVQSR